MLNYKPKWEDFGISRFRYDELVAFCRQYPEKKAEAASLLGVGSQRLDGMPRGTDVSDPVGRAAERRESLLNDIALIEKCAMNVEGGKWFAALIQNICMRKAYQYIDSLILPTSKRCTFFKQRRQFFILLDKELNDRKEKQQ